MRTGWMLGPAMIAVSFVSVVQHQHHKAYPLSTHSIDLKLPQPRQESTDVVWIFGRAYPNNQIRSWFERIEGKYCTYGDQIYIAGSVPGEPISYPQFVFALQKGFYFHCYPME